VILLDWVIIHKHHEKCDEFKISRKLATIPGGAGELKYGGAIFSRNKF
jgi:hypothetical protein